MAGVSRFTAQERAKRALWEAAKLAFEDDVSDKKVTVSYGFTWPVRTRDLIGFVDTDSEVNTVDIGPRRSLDERITLSVNVGVWRPGHGEEAEMLAAGDAFGYLERLQDHVRVNDITLGGAVLWCLPGSSSSSGMTDDLNARKGRYHEIAATFVCAHRITTA